MFKDFFKDEKGSPSMTRLVTFILVATAVILAFLGGWLIIAGKIITELIYLISVLLGFALGAKVTQKFAEKEKETNING